MCGVRGGGRSQRDTPTTTHTHTNTHANTHTLHTNNTHNAQRTNAQHTTQNTQGVNASSAYHFLPMFGYHLAPEVHQRKSWILHIFSLRIDREQHVPDSSNHSLSMIKLFSFSRPDGHFGGNQLPDCSISLSPLPHHPPPPQPQPQPRPQRPPQQHTTHHQHNTTLHGDRDRERRQRKRRETKRRSLPQACFTIFRVLTCASTHIHTYTLYTQRYTYKHIYMYMYMYVYIHVIMNRHGHHFFLNWNCVGAKRPQHRHMYRLIACD